MGVGIGVGLPFKTFKPNIGLKALERNGFVTDNLEAFWHAGNYNGKGTFIKNEYSPSTWVDLTGNSHNVTLTNFLWTTSSGADGENTPSDPARIVFDGVDDHAIKNISDTELEITGDITILAYLKSTSGTGFHTLVCKGEDYYDGYIFRTRNAATYDLDLRQNRNDGFSYSGIPETPVNNYDNFNMIGVKFDGANLTAYQDTNKGTRDDTPVANAYLDGDKNLFIGRKKSGEYLDGSIVWLALYKKALSDAEVLQNYNAGMVWE